MEKAYKSTIALVPDVSVWPSIQAIRRVHDEQYFRWPPHINMLYPFIKNVDEAIATRGDALRNALRKIQPFTLTLSTFGYFRHKKNNTAWLAPSTTPASAIHDLQATLVDVYGECNELAEQFTPHLSVGQAAAGEIVPLTKECQLTWKPIECIIDRVYVMTRAGYEDPFRVMYILHLGSGEITVPDAHFDVNEAIDNIQKVKPSTAAEGHSSGGEDQKTEPKKSESQKKGEDSKKPKMRTSEDVMKRIRWDQKYAGDWLIGYQDSSDVGIKEVTLEEWDRGLPRNMGTIPMHRIQYFKFNGDIVWDRSKRLDKVFNSTT